MSAEAPTPFDAAFAAAKAVPSDTAPADAPAPDETAPDAPAPEDVPAEPEVVDLHGVVNELVSYETLDGSLHNADGTSKYEPGLDRGKQELDAAARAANEAR
jgi:hypothetical protein